MKDIRDEVSWKERLLLFAVWPILTLFVSALLLACTIFAIAILILAWPFCLTGHVTFNQVY